MFVDDQRERIEGHVAIGSFLSEPQVGERF
jgi:hypothetical protein